MLSLNPIISICWYLLCICFFHPLLGPLRPTLLSLPCLQDPLNMLLPLRPWFSLLQLSLDMRCVGQEEKDKKKGINLESIIRLFYRWCVCVCEWERERQANWFCIFPKENWDLTVLWNYKRGLDIFLFFHSFLSLLCLPPFSLRCSGL